MQVPVAAAADDDDAGSLSLFHGDSVSLQLKAPAGGKSSTTDFFFNDDIEEKTKKLQLVVRESCCVQLVVRKSRCVDDCSHVFMQLCVEYGCRIVS